VAHAALLQHADGAFDGVVGPNGEELGGHQFSDSHAAVPFMS